MILRLLFLTLLQLTIFISSTAYAYNTNDGEYGSYWYNLSSITLQGSSSYEVAMLSCTGNCVDVTYHDDFTYTNGTLRVRYYQLFENGSSGYIAISVLKDSCDSSTSNIASCQEGYQSSPQICEDGYPPNVYGYEDYCDRPTPKQCADGSYVESSSYCPVDESVCTDYDTCYQYAQNQANCYSDAAAFTFNYQSPSAFDFSCETIDTSSPDHPDNGGNADGNEYNDPLSPEATITSGESDPSVLATAIGLELRSDFGNVERAVRDGISAAESNTDRTIDAINSAQSSLDASLSNIESAINEGNSADNGSSSIVDSVNGASSNITDSISQSSSDALNAISESSGDIVDSVQDATQSIIAGNSVLSDQLSEISSKLDDIESCDPTNDATSCEGEHGITESFISSMMNTLEALFDDENESSLETIKSEVSSIESVSPLDSSVLDGVFDPLLNVIPQPQECIPLTFGDSSKPYSFTLSCEFSDKFKAIFGFLLALYTVQSLIGIIISSARPRKEGN